jgi:uncharacterized glyoxalase superfamily protein PhnB
MLAKGELPGIMLRTDDLDGGNAEILQEPADQFWGARDAAFRDPAGNMLRMSQA